MSRASLLCVALVSALACGDASKATPAVDAGEPELPVLIDVHGCRPDADYLVGGGRFDADLCRDGDCQFDLSLSSLFELLNSECIGYQATLRVMDSAGRQRYVVSADLSDATWDRAARLGEALRLQQLDNTYSCPDCRDQAVAWVRTQAPADEAKQFSYVVGKPPPALVAVDGFVQGLISQLRSCEGADLLLCSRQP